MRMENKQIHDTLFRDIFNDETRLLSLSNALTGKDFKSPDDVHINTLPGSYFSNLKNDVSCNIGDMFLIIVEHQKTVNENMPLRMLRYIVNLFDEYIAPIRKKLYHMPRIALPFPTFFTLLEGDKTDPAIETLHLSDAYGGDGHTLELNVPVININSPANEELIKKCPYLYGYCCLINLIDEYKKTMPPEQAVSHAIKECIKNGILVDYLTKKEKEVWTMLAYEWNEDEAREAWREEGYDKAIENVALSMLLNGADVNFTAKCTKLPLSHVQEIKSSLKN